MCLLQSFNLNCVESDIYIYIGEQVQWISRMNQKKQKPAWSKSNLQLMERRLHEQWSHSKEANKRSWRLNELIQHVCSLLTQQEGHLYSTKLKSLKTLLLTCTDTLMSSLETIFHLNIMKMSFLFRLRHFFKLNLNLVFDCLTSDKMHRSRRNQTGQ